MKKLMLATLMVVSLGLTQVSAQLYFGVSPGLGLNSAQFGYKLNKFVPYISLQYLNGNTNTTIKYIINDGLGNYTEYTDEIKGSINVVIPTIGAKYFFIDKGNLKGYGNLAVSKPFIGGSTKYNGQSNPAFKDALNDLTIWGAELGFGAEYFLSENFSLGGEFGLRSFFVKHQSSRFEYYYDQNSTQETEYSTDVKLNINPTYSRISLNYYF